MELSLKEYTKQEKDKWDRFVLKESMNGTFLQTRNFLEYHGTRFKDSSLIIYKGENVIVAIIPACRLEENGKKVFSSHPGSTFGGIVFGEKFYNIEHVEAVVTLFENYIRKENYQIIQLKCTPEIFCKKRNDLINYYLYKNGYYSYEELSSYIDFDDYQDEIIKNFTARKRRDYKYSLQNSLEFRKLQINEIYIFYNILIQNLHKFGTKPVHSLQELTEFKEKRLKDKIEFYGVFHQGEMIAGSMVFRFERKVFHTQYLAVKQDKLDFYPMNFLNENLIEEAKREKFRYFSFGISTENKGKVLNKSLAQFKEGFGTSFAVNRIYEKTIGEVVL